VTTTSGAHSKQTRVIFWVASTSRHKEDDANMNMTPGAGVGLIPGQQTVQTVLLIVASFVTVWMLYIAPWQVSGDPCLLAAVATGVVIVFLWATRWQGSRGVSFERNLLAAFLVAMPLVYVARYLFASTGGAAKHWLWIEVLGVIIFAALAVLGLKRSAWFLAIGIVAHGLAWDSWHYRKSTYIPDWYAISCLAVDLALGAYVAVRVPAYRRASRIETVN
jgi:hypothetical protein